MKFKFGKKKKSQVPKVILGILGVAAAAAAVSYLFESGRVQQLTDDLKSMATNNQN